MRLTKTFLMLTMMLLISLAAGAPDEAMGRVSKVVDGDTFDVTLESHDSRISEELIRIRLADIDTPEVRGPKACEAGKKASAYTKKWLTSRTVTLDLDDKTGKDQYGRWVAVCYLDGKNFNKQLVDSGHAVIKDFKNNEFDPLSWWN
ncbi:MAG: thermonuclease family protein [Methanothrix sp.]